MVSIFFIVFRNDTSIAPKYKLWVVYFHPDYLHYSWVYLLTITPTRHNAVVYNRLTNSSLSSLHLPIRWQLTSVSPEHKLIYITEGNTIKFYVNNVQLCNIISKVPTKPFENFLYQNVMHAGNSCCDHKINIKIVIF